MVGLERGCLLSGSVSSSVLPAGPTGLLLRCAGLWGVVLWEEAPPFCEVGIMQ